MGVYGEEEKEEKEKKEEEEEEEKRRNRYILYMCECIVYLLTSVGLVVVRNTLTMGGTSRWR